MEQAPQKKLTAQQGCGLGCLSVIVLLGGLIVFFFLKPDATDDWDSVGEKVKVKEVHGVWPCGSSRDALLAMDSAPDAAAMFRAMRESGSFALTGGMSVLVLQIGHRERKVRVLTDDSGHDYYKDPRGVYSDSRIGRECWVDLKALE